MAQLTPEQFNKPCLMSYGEIAERLAVWLAESCLQVPRNKTTGLGTVLVEDGDTTATWAHRVSAGLMALEKVDVR